MQKYYATQLLIRAEFARQNNYAPVSGRPVYLVSEADAKIAEIQSAYDKLTGEKFSDRVHAALHSRIAELERKVAIYAGRDEAKQCVISQLERERDALRAALEKIAAGRTIDDEGAFNSMELMHVARQALSEAKESE